MPNLQSFAVLDQRVKKYKSDYSLENMGNAFDWVVLDVLLGLNRSEIDDVIVDDSMDGGIDAIHISERDVNIFTFTYAETFESASKNFQQNKLDNLIVTVQQILNNSGGPHHQDSGEAKIRESTAGVSRKPSSDGKARGSSSKHLCGLTAWNT